MGSYQNINVAASLLECFKKMNLENVFSFNSVYLRGRRSWLGILSMVLCEFTSTESACGSSSCSSFQSPKTYGSSKSKRQVVQVYVWVQAQPQTSQSTQIGQLHRLLYYPVISLWCPADQQVQRIKNEISQALRWWRIICHTGSVFDMELCFESLFVLQRIFLKDWDCEELKERFKQSIKQATTKQSLFYTPTNT